MLQIKDIRKQYQTGEFVQTALDGVSLNLRDNEFVAILGPSGSGKTTLLNIIGGLDRYDSGDLIIDGTSTKQYKDRDWDSYRNHSVGFVFQSYNLIPHQSVLSNVELALTISGISKAERKERAIASLKDVGLGDHLHKKPNQLSGGQMQRVAIARALVNNPNILLADEPTGALDTETSVQIMELLKEVAKDRLVVMVTHNPELAHEYANRIVNLKDGHILDDSNPFELDASASEEAVHRNLGKASMSFFTSLALSFNNLKTKKARTFLTAFAGSIGIIGISLILSLSNGVNNYIEDIQKETMLSYPMTIEAQSIDLSSLLQVDGEAPSDPNREIDPSRDAVYGNSFVLERVSSVTTSIKENNLTAFKQYLDDPKSEIHQYVGENGIQFTYDIAFDTFSFDSEETLVNNDGSSFEEEDAASSSSMMPMSAFPMSASMSTSHFQEMLPGADEASVSQAILDSYNLEAGVWPANYDEVILLLNVHKEIETSALYELGLLPASDYKEILAAIDAGETLELEEKTLSYEEVMNTEFYLIPASDYFVENEEGLFDDVSGDTAAIEGLLEEAIKLKVVGVASANEDASYTMTSPIGYTRALTNYLIDYSNNSPVVLAQEANPDINVLNGLEFAPADDEAKIADAKAYLSNLTLSEKAQMMQEIMMMSPTDPSDQATMPNTETPEDSEETAEATEEMAMPENAEELAALEAANPEMANSPEAQAAQMLSMSEEELAAMFDDYLADPDTESLLMVYDNYLSPGTLDDNLLAFGSISLDAPTSINIYSDSFEAKDGITQSIDNYNKTAADADQISYTDLVGMLMSSVTTIVNVVSYVLVAFVGVSLVVSSIMIGIITFISVLERTKEIGILRAMGASKRNISQVFNAETFIIGALSGLLGVGISLLLLIPINAVIHNLVGTTSVNASLSIPTAIALVALSMTLTLIAGLLPSREAAKKDPVIALRTE